LPENKTGFKKIKHYMSASLLTTIAGLITFPVLTRLLSKADYGIFSLIQGGQLIYEAVLKGGGQFSIVRFYPIEFSEVKSNKTRFFSNLILIPLLLSTIITSVISICVIVYSIFYSDIYIVLLVLISAQSTIVLSYLRSYMQASSLSKYDALLDILSKYIYLLCVIPIVLFFLTNYWGVYWAIAISSLSVTCLSIYLNKDIFKYLTLRIDKNLIISSLKYSFPLLLTEISVLSISYADRFIMASMDIEMSDIGIYAIGFGLANVVFMLIWKVLQPAVLPVVNNLHDCVSLSSSVNYLSNVTNFFILIFSALSVGVALNCNEFIILLSGEDKSEAGLVFFLATLLFLIKIIEIFVFYGLHLLKKTKNIFISELLVAICNIVFNIILIPYLGIYGAMLASYLSVLLGILFKLFNLDKKYRIERMFHGYLPVVTLLSVYILVHIYVIEVYVSSPFLILLLSITIFFIILSPLWKSMNDKFRVIFE